ncbi:glycosyltransferase [Aequorivita vladivostokensis]|nr:glycosyltransferase [Aequorivita vladivostokensis]
MQNKTCALLNFGSFYRTSIFILMDKELNCDFYFGNKTRTPIKKMDYKVLRNFQREFKYLRIFGKFNWLRGTTSLLFKDYDIYILTGEAYCLSNWLILIYSRIFNKKVFLWTHGWYGRERGIAKYIKKFFFGLSSGLFLYGDYSKSLLLSEGFKENKLIPIYNSLDYQKHLNVRKSLTKTLIYKDKFKNDFPTLIYVGRIQKSKRIDLIFQALKKLKENDITPNFVLVGNIIDDYLLEKMVNDLEIVNQVWFYGACYEQEKLGELFYNAIVCISPGNVGLTAIHSLSFGTPVITHNNFKYQGPEFEAIVEGETGSLFEENNIDDLVKKIKQYIDLSEVQRDLIRKESYRIIDERYNPYLQIKIMKRAVLT